MNSREKILAAVKKSQPPLEALPSIESIPATTFADLEQQFKMVLETIGGTLLFAKELQEVTGYVLDHFTENTKYVTTVHDLPGIQKVNDAESGHLLEDVEVAIIRGSFGVAENSAVWVSGTAFRKRVLPFICQHLVVILQRSDIVSNMHQAYDRIGDDGYDYGVFIAGPSKTADIEQSLVLGAHGPKSMTVFLFG